jgi:beta-lactamase regulating signal transducer with metallopeptidase domain
MNGLLSLVPVLLLRWTVLLALGWSVHWLLRYRDARWRLILWRCLLCFGLVLPVAHWLSIPVVKIPIGEIASLSTEAPDTLLERATASQLQGGKPVLQPAEKPVEVNAPLRSASPALTRIASAPVSWTMALVMVWALGVSLGSIRLIWFWVSLFRLKNGASTASPAIQKFGREIQFQLGVRRAVRIQISDSIQSPFVCGLWKPNVMLPRSLAEHLSAGEAAALLGHEIAHLRRHDLFWCMGWRWLTVIGWFHPLVWKIPAAHSLACEEEADRVASGEVANRDSYAQLLAQLALRVLALPAVETRLTVNGSSQIARRLQHLERPGAGMWNWRHTLAGFGVAGVLLLIAGGWEFAKVKAESSTNLPAIEFKKVLVVVEDENGKPIEGATILPDGFRVQGPRRVDGHGWLSKEFGPPEKALTDQDGKAYVRYPMVAIPEEKLLTGELTFTVNHPDFCRVRTQGYPVDGSGTPFHLKRGIPLEVSGYFGRDRQPVTELVVNLSDPEQGYIKISPEDWQKKENGVYAFRQLSPGGHILQLMGRLASGAIVYSEGFSFTSEEGKEYKFALEMKPGIRLEGRLDDNVPRPVKNGRVLISVRPKEIPAWLIPEDFKVLMRKYGDVYFWRTYRPIAADGTFVFESIPPGEVDVTAQGEGFASQSIGKVQNRIGGQIVDGPVIGIPQPFPLVAPVTKIEVKTEPTATVEVTAKTKDGKPVKGVNVSLNPNVLRMNGIFGNMEHSSEEPFRAMTPMPYPPYRAATDENGKVVMPNIPAVLRWLNVWHPQYEAPLTERSGFTDRTILVKAEPGKTSQVAVTMQPVGTDFIGSVR